MSQLSDLFSSGKFKSAFIPYYSLGDPNYDASIHWGRTLIDGGADIVELGIPFSDPIGDGPVIQKAFSRAFQNPFSLDTIFSVASEIHKTHPQAPLVFMSYYNPLYTFGVGAFLQKAKDSGISALILPDLPFDTRETGSLFRQARALDMDLIHLVTPATTKKRIKAMKEISSGFVYYVTSFGVTGERKEFSTDLEDRIRLVRTELNLPVCAGFGISTADQASRIAQFADGIIIGSAIQRIIEEFGNDSETCKTKLFHYAKEIRSSFS